MGAAGVGSVSYVTGVILLARPGEWEHDDQSMLKRVNEYFASFGEGWPGNKGLVDVEDPGGWYGGTKCLECCMAVGSFNYLDLEEFIEHLKSLRGHWQDPEDVQLLVCEQEDSTWRFVLEGIES